MVYEFGQERRRSLGQSELGQDQAAYLETQRRVGRHECVDGYYAQ